MTAFNFADYANGTALNSLDGGWQKAGAINWPTVQSGELTWEGWGECYVFLAAGAASYNNVSRATLQATLYGKNAINVLSTAAQTGYLLRTQAPADGSILETFRLDRNGTVIQNNFGGALNLDGNTYHEVMLICAGNASSVTLELWLDGVMIDSTTDTPPQAGWPGLWVSDPSHAPTQFNVGRWSSAVVDFTDIAAQTSAVASVSASLATTVSLSANNQTSTGAEAAITVGIQLVSAQEAKPFSNADLWTKTGGLYVETHATAGSSAELDSGISFTAEAVAKASLDSSLTGDISLTTADASGIPAVLADGTELIIDVPDWLTVDGSTIPVLLETGLIADIHQLVHSAKPGSQAALEAQTLLAAALQAKASGIGDLETLKLLKADTGALPFGIADLSTWSDPGVINPVDPRADVQSPRAQLLIGNGSAVVTQYSSGVARVLH